MRNWSATGACDTQFVVNISALKYCLTIHLDASDTKLYMEKSGHIVKKVFSQTSVLPRLMVKNQVQAALKAVHQYALTGC